MITILDKVILILSKQLLYGSNVIEIYERSYLHDNYDITFY